MKRLPDALTLLLMAIAFGIAFMPMVLLAALAFGVDPSPIAAALGVAYAGIVAIVAPLVAKRRANGGGNGNGS